VNLSVARRERFIASLNVRFSARFESYIIGIFRPCFTTCLNESFSMKKFHNRYLPTYRLHLIYVISPRPCKFTSLDWSQNQLEKFVSNSINKNRIIKSIAFCWTEFCTQRDERPNPFQSL
jgi:hypothetical protein